ncbi:hypothetical protein GQ53DRAFT_504524 [Thozetella sp. PMI_491]|nr:hypothetical protein GQ53DRAFT_504524 [Thozetella sp. PMI_491]
MPPGHLCSEGSLTHISPLRRYRIDGNPGVYTAVRTGTENIFNDTSKELGAYLLLPSLALKNTTTLMTTSHHILFSSFSIRLVTNAEGYPSKELRCRDDSMAGWADKCPHAGPEVFTAFLFCGLFFFRSLPFRSLDSFVSSGGPVAFRSAIKRKMDGPGGVFYRLCNVLSH